MDVSLNEIESLALKAARGSGLPWGVADDTGRAAAWMARRVADWADSLLPLLETPPAPAENPLLIAGFLADMLAAREPWRTGRVRAPVWLLPGVVAAHVRTGGAGLTIRLGDALVRCGPAGEVAASCALEALAALPAGPAALDFSATEPPLAAFPVAARFARGTVDADHWHRLEALAHRTYVPASDLSRLKGAGAGRLDDE